MKILYICMCFDCTCRKITLTRWLNLFWISSNIEKCLTRWTTVWIRFPLNVSYYKWKDDTRCYKYLACCCKHRSTFTGVKSNLREIQFDILKNALTVATLKAPSSLTGFSSAMRVPYETYLEEGILFQNANNITI